MTPTRKQDEVATLWLRLRQAPAQPMCWLELARAYAADDLPWQAGYAARQASRLDAGLLPALQTLAIDAWQDGNAGDAVLGRAALADAAALAKRFTARVGQSPGDWLSWLYLARLQDLTDAPNGAATARQRAQTLEPINGESLHWLGVWRLNAGDASGAVAALTELLNLRPIRFGSMMYLGEALLRVGNIAAAEKAFTRASLSPNPDFLQTLSTRVYAHNYWQEAIDILHKALTFRPDSVPILLALTRIQWEVYELSAAQQGCCRMLALDPGNKDAAYMLAALPGRMGDAKGHLAAVQQEYAAAADPLSRLASSIAMASLYHDAMPAAEVADLHRSVCAPIEAALTHQTDFANERTLGRRLRIGYVSGDFHRQHPVNLFMLPVLLRHDRARLEVFVYHTGTMHDEYTHQAKGSAEHWFETLKLDDTELQQAIVADRIDILIDLAGHTSTHRLGVFAMGAAPVQATFLGYPHSTGLSRIDWLIGDAMVSPAAHAPLFSEGIAQLPGSVFCWAPVDQYPLPPARTSAAPLVLGSFNNTMKLSPKTIALWARVLHALPHAHLLLKAPSLRDAAVQASFVALFAAQGIDEGRLQLRGPTGLAEMMQEYGDIDLALDPTPYNGGTTTLQALWMGVPVLVLTGGNFAGRMGASFMHSLGRDEWVAADEDAYVAAAVALAADVQTLRGQRAELRRQMTASALCDITTYVANLETLLETMWTRHCAGDQRRLIAVAAP